MQSKIDVKKENSTTLLEREESATAEQIAAAIETLTPTQLLRLESYARFRMQGLGSKSSGRDHEDLLREAMAATLSGSRQWNRRVSFFGHLLGVMRSLSSHWRERPSATQLFPVPEMGTADGLLPQEGADPERTLAAKQTLRQIADRFRQDEGVQLVLKGFCEGISGPEVQAHYGMSELQYEAALRRLRRFTVRMETQEGAVA